jgi:CDP-diacylglycerol--glycerol-3-phosphate 3-phosphatidyltransferase
MGRLRPGHGRARMNLPNKLTVSRLVLTAVFLVAMFWPFPYHKTVALILFLAAGLTDFGRHDRAPPQAHYDVRYPDGSLADKILTCSAFIAFVGHDVIGRTYVQAWMVVIIVGRELAITGLRLLAANKNVVLAAEGYGKHKTASQIACVIGVLILLSYPEWGPMGKTLFGFPVFGRPWVEDFARLSAWVTVGMTFVSGGIYLWRNRQLYLTM